MTKKTTAEIAIPKAVETSSETSLLDFSQAVEFSGAWVEDSYTAFSLEINKSEILSAVDARVGRLSTLFFTHVSEETQAIQRNVLGELNALSQRVESLEFVHPRLVTLAASGDAPSQSREEIGSSALNKMVELSTAVERQDEVDSSAIIASLRVDLRNMRDASETPRFRRFALSLVQDALTFTRLDAFDAAKVERLRSIFLIAIKDEIAASDLDALREGLEDAGFELFPSSAA